MKFYNPRFDVTFRKVFGSTAPRETVLSLLNSVLRPSPQETILEVFYDDTAQSPIAPEAKITHQDLICTDASGNKFVVELQVAEQSSFFKRLLYYFSKLYVKDLKTGEKYHELKKVCIIAILDFTVFKDPKSYVDPEHEPFKEVLEMFARKRKTREMPEIEFHILELPKFEKKLEECKTVLDQWFFFFKQSERLSAIPSTATDIGVVKAYNNLNEFNLTDEERAVYDREVKSFRDAEDVERFKLEKAEAVGEAKGLKQGLEKGKAEGEKKAKLEMAKKMIVEGMSAEIVTKMTGLSAEEIEELKA